jgi:hypothetical protein
VATTTKAKTPTIEDVTRRMIADEDAWPRWPVLPLKRYAPDLECGCLVAAPGSLAITRIVTRTNLWAGGHAEAIRAGDCYRYATVDDLIADGWVVD